MITINLLDIYLNIGIFVFTLVVIDVLIAHAICAREWYVKYIAGESVYQTEHRTFIGLTASFSNDADEIEPYCLILLFFASTLVAFLCGLLFGVLWIFAVPYILFAKHTNKLRAQAKQK